MDSVEHHFCLPFIVAKNNSLNDLGLGQFCVQGREWGEIDVGVGVLQERTLKTEHI